MRPLAVSFFNVVGGEIRSSVVSGSELPPPELARRVRSWKARLAGREPLAPRSLAALSDRIATPRQVEAAAVSRSSEWLRHAYREIGAVNDLRLLIRDGRRLVAGVTVWRRFEEAAWTQDQLRSLEALQPLIERAYLGSLRASSNVAAALPLPAALTSRQRQVALLLAAGSSNAEIGRALHISPNTVKTHAREVFSTVGVTSRRELAMRVAQDAKAEAARPGPDDGARALLNPVLEWSAHRLGVVLGGCVLLSPRGVPVAAACDCAPALRETLDPQLAQRLHDLIVAPDGAGLVPNDAAREPWTVARLDAKAGGTADRAFELVAGLGFTMPTLLTLRVRGRLAGLVWLCREAKAASSQAEAESLLRAVQPLAELCVAEHASGPGRSQGGGLDMASRGLSAREMTVARMALAGEGNGAIAARLEITEATVKKHMTRILAKCGVRSRTELIATLTGARTTFG